MRWEDWARFFSSSSMPRFARREGDEAVGSEEDGDFESRLFVCLFVCCSRSPSSQLRQSSKDKSCSCLGRMNGAETVLSA
jgi:hypothetical protein